MVPTAKQIIINISIFLAPTRSESLPMMTVMTAPETMYAVITQDASDKETWKWFATLERAGDMAVLRNKNITIVELSIRADFQALNDICSVGIVEALADNLLQN